MKKAFLILSLVSVVVFTISCKKDSDGTSPSMKAKVDAVAWESIARYSSVTANNIIITGTSLKGEVIGITVFAGKTGTYTINPLAAQVQCSGYYSLDKLSASDSSKSYFASEGTVVISSIDVANKKISGTFSFTARIPKDLTKTKSITEGTFSNLSY